MNKALLPTGLHDLLFPKAGAQINIVAKISKHVEGYGYQKVSPPAIEYEDSLFAGAGRFLKKNTFRFMDPQSDKMMGVRSDMTVQIARIAATRLVNTPKPLRLSYAGDVFRVKGDGLHAERQFTQTGIELIGVDNAYADAEVVIVALGALKAAGVKRLCIDFNLPDLAGIVLKELGFKKEDRKPLFSAIKRKDETAINNLAGDGAELILKLINYNIMSEDISNIAVPDSAKVLFYRLIEVINIVKDKLPDVQISIDPLGAGRFSYHSGIGFSIFAKGAKAELGRGGRYKIDEDSGGIGATLYVNELFRLLPRPVPKEKVLIPFDTGAAKIESLQKEGYVIVHSLEHGEDMKKTAQYLGCSCYLDGKQLKTV
ncbi:MAG: ATP phosphoribosyltransferase regulatory subunit [Alphaproteobacteria bacterium CG11_big_fil_rev_8_21_14_0_20_39_49]|nr:MAG: ATP phosphoribosyltransferase regulatory subunit [Alphaproteobacteria bacterium CG11_big_fil_rev_8_21_14_0_20_39_49]